MTVAVLALQGAFIEHEHVLEELGVKTVELRQAADLDQPYDGLILPGGESTVQGKLLRELRMFDPLRKQIADGLPVLGTCAGLILLGSPEHFGTIPMQVKRNAYGRQLGSFHTEAEFKDLGLVPMSFIRAPYVESVSDGVEVLSVVDDHIVGVRYGIRSQLLSIRNSTATGRSIRCFGYDQLKTGRMQHSLQSPCSVI